MILISSWKSELTISASAGRMPLCKALAANLSRMLRVDEPYPFCLQKLRQSYSFGSFSNIFALSTTPSSSLRKRPSVDAVSARVWMSLTYRINFLLGNRRRVLISLRELDHSTLIASSMSGMFSTTSRMPGPSKSLLTIISTLGMSRHASLRHPIHDAANADIRRVCSGLGAQQDVQGFE